MRIKIMSFHKNFPQEEFDSGDYQSVLIMELYHEDNEGQHQNLIL